MRRLLILTVALALGANCASHQVAQTSNSVNQSPSPLESPTPAATQTRDGSGKESDEKKEAPREFSKIDFKNFSYPISWKHQTVRLKDGHLEFFEDKIFYNAWFDLDGVDYADLNTDGKKEAVVQLHWVSCGASCDGGSSLFYFYQLHGRTPRLLTRIETGSLAYQECGLKSFSLHRKKLVLETFQVCRFNGISVKPKRKTSGEDPIGKFGANNYTRFTLRFTGSGFALQNRKVFPWPQGDAMNYEPEISIKNE